MLCSGALEVANEPYAIAKIVAIKLCESYNRQYDPHYRFVMPTNLYGQGDKFHLDNSRITPGLIRCSHEAKMAGVWSVSIWGRGYIMREFLHVNVGTGKDVTIRDIPETIKAVVGVQGALVFDVDKSDGCAEKFAGCVKDE